MVRGKHGLVCVVCFVFGCINDYDEERASDGLFGKFGWRILFLVKMMGVCCFWKVAWFGVN